MVIGLIFNDQSVIAVTDPVSSQIEWHPAHFKINKKIAIILNGDSQESRHLENVDRAINVLRKKGFNFVFVAQDKSIEIEPPIFQYPGTKEGLDRLFQSVYSAIEENDLIFIYGTGHGISEEGGSIYVNEAIGIEEVKAYVVPLKKKGGKIVGVFDNCYSGKFSQALIEEVGIEGTVVSPGIEGEETLCQFFAPNFFENIDNEIDLNRDGISQISEMFISAMEYYRSKTDKEAYGQFAQSEIELTLTNFEKMEFSQKPALITVSATWCGPCKMLSRELNLLKGVIGEQLDLYILTANKNPEKDELLKKLDFEVSGFPTMIMKNTKKQFELLARGYHSFDELTRILQEKLNLRVDQKGLKYQIIHKIKEEHSIDENTINRFLSVAGDNEAMWDLLPYIDKDVWNDLESLSTTTPLLFDKRVEEEKCRSIAHLTTEDLSTFMKHFHRYKTCFTKDNLAAMLRAIQAEFPDSIIVDFDIYNEILGIDEARELFNVCIKQKSSYEVLPQYFNKYKDSISMNELKLLFNEVVSYKPEAFLAHFKTYADFFDRAFLEDLLLSALRSWPWYAFFYFEQYADFLGIERAAELIENFADYDPLSAIKYVRYYAPSFSTLFIRKILKKSLPRLEPNTIWIAFEKFTEFAQYFENKWEAREYFKSLANKYLSYKYCDFDELPIIEKWLTKVEIGNMLRRSIDTVRSFELLENFKKIKVYLSNTGEQERYFNKLIKKAIKEDRCFIPLHFEHFYEEPHAVDILVDTIKQCPAKGVYLFNSYQPYLEKIAPGKAVDLLKISILSDPYEAVCGFGHYNVEPFAKELFSESFDKNKWAGIACFEKYFSYFSREEQLVLLRRALANFATIAVSSLQFNNQNDSQNSSQIKTAAEELFAMNKVYKIPFGDFEYYNKQEYIQRLFLEVLKDDSTMKTELLSNAGILFMRAYKSDPDYIDSFSEEILGDILLYNPEAFFQYFHAIQHEEFAERLLIKAAREYPELAITYYENYKKLPSAKLIYEYNTARSRMTN